MYFEALDLATETIRERFEQDDFQNHLQLEEMLLKASNGKLEEAGKELFKIVSAFPKDFHHYELKMDLQYLAAQDLNCRSGLEDLKSFMSRREVQKLMPQATKGIANHSCQPCYERCQ